MSCLCNFLLLFSSSLNYGIASLFSSSSDSDNSLSNSSSLSIYSLFSSISVKYGANGYMILAGLTDHKNKLPFVVTIIIEKCDFECAVK